MTDTVPTFRIDTPEVIADPYALFAAMRRSGRVCRLEPSGFWAVSCVELIDAVAERGRFELVTDITVPLPMIVIAELLGVEPERRRDFKRWCDDLISTLSLTGAADPARSRQATRELASYFREIIDARRRAPQDDLITRLVQAEIEGSKLSLPEVVSFANVLLVAGNLALHPRPQRLVLQRTGRN